MGFVRRTAAFFAAVFFLCVPALAVDVFRVQHVSDGDTLVLSDGTKVRLLGVDTPEMDDAYRNRSNASRNHLDAKTVQSYAKNAKRFTAEQVEGKQVRLEYDWQRKDKYGRTLAYVFREGDDYFLNAELLKQGYAFPYLYFPFKRLEEFRGYADEARLEKRGLWK